MMSESDFTNYFFLDFFKFIHLLWPIIRCLVCVIILLHAFQAVYSPSFTGHCKHFPYYRFNVLSFVLSKIIYATDCTKCIFRFFITKNDKDRLDLQHPIPHWFFLVGVHRKKVWNCINVRSNQEMKDPGWRLSQSNHKRLSCLFLFNF